MEKIRTLESQDTTERFINNGTSCMLINGRVNQLRVNSTQDSVFTLKETSMSFQPYQVEDILTSSITETWSSRFLMEDQLKNGTSTNNP
jgi:hypothetical protein